MSIEESIKKIAEEQFSECGYVFANWYEADERMNKTKCPFILALVPVAGTIRRKNGRMRNRETVNDSMIPMSIFVQTGFGQIYRLPSYARIHRSR